MSCKVAVKNEYMKQIYFLIKQLPVISFGCGKSIILRIDGATSARRPFSTVAFLSVVTYTNGTGLREWAVFGVPSALIAWSALPWSAIMITS